MPNTISGNYGSRVATNIGQQMQNLEFKFYAEKRRRKLGNDLVCY
jgi:abhydrolase domain-containing protein 1/3